MDEATLRADPRLAKLVPLVQERIKLLTEAADKVDWAFQRADEITYPDPAQLLGKGMDVAQTAHTLRTGAEALSEIEPFTAAAIEEAFRKLAEEAGHKVGSFFAPFRVAITGRTVSPPLFESMEVLGREETLRRIENAIRALQASPETV
jgi:glutamyl-tRNA synthetase